MNFIISKLKISNFLSFFGEYEVNFKPFSAVMCNFYEGKDDLLRAFEFVFGSQLTDLRVESPIDLVHTILKEEFLINHNVQSYVEVTVSFLQEKQELKFSRIVRNGSTTPRIEHKISNRITTSENYEEILNTLGLYIPQKNLIIYKKYFNNAIWGSSEDLEETICTFLRENYMFDEWKKANKKVEYLKKLKNQIAKKNYYSMRKSHLLIAEYTQKFQSFYQDRERFAKKILLNHNNDSSEENTPSSGECTEEETNARFLENQQDSSILNQKINNLTEQIHDLKLLEAVFISQFYHEEIKLANAKRDTSITQARINHLKNNIQETENQIPQIWEESEVLKSELKTLDQKISWTLASLQEMENKNYLQNRLTQYGRFCDYLQPSRYFHLVQNIIGADLFYAHLCDSVEDALELVQQVKDSGYEHREVFLPLEIYSHRFKDLIIASGEEGIQINTLEELLILLCKLKHYQLIDDVPVIVQKDFNFEISLPEDYTIFLHNNIHFTSEGLISCYTDEKYFLEKTEKELQESLNQFYIEEEINYRKWNDLIFKKYENLVEMNALENDLFWIKHMSEKSTQVHPSEHELSPLSEIYEEYYNIFEDDAKEKKKYESTLPEKEKESMVSFDDKSMDCFSRNLARITTEKEKLQTELQDLTQKLLQLSVTPVYRHSLRKRFIKFRFDLNKTIWFLEKEIKTFKKILKENDLEDFLPNQDWRKIFIASIIKDLNEIKLKLKAYTEEQLNIATERKRKLYQLFDHCSKYLSNTLRHIVSDALPFIKMDFSSEEETIHILSSLGEEELHIVDIKHFNTLLRFLSAFSLFLEIASFDTVPILIMDDIEEYFPIHQDDLKAALGLKTLEEILPNDDNPRFHFLMRVGQFLQYYIKKNTPGRLIRSNGENSEYTSGPVQIIYFATEELVHAADHYIWIQNQILPEEYLTTHCNSYSALYEIHFEN